jgi:SAM-dependent methyltransferase
VSTAMIALARERHPEARLFHADICRWEPPPSYDLIVPWDSVWHVPLAEQAAVPTKLCRVLRAGGVLVFTAGGTDAPDAKKTRVWERPCTTLSSVSPRLCTCSPRQAAFAASSNIVDAPDT